MKVYTAFVSRTMTIDEPAKPEVYILEASLAGFEIDGRQIIKKSNGTYEANDGSWRPTREEAVADAIAILRGRAAEMTKKIEELRGKGA